MDMPLYKYERKKLVKLYLKNGTIIIGKSEDYTKALDNPNNKASLDMMIYKILVNTNPKRIDSYATWFNEDEIEKVEILEE